MESRSQLAMAMRFGRTPLGLWVPAPEEEPPSEMPLAVAQRLFPPDQPLLVHARRGSTDGLKAYFGESELRPELGVTPLTRGDIIGRLSTLPRAATLQHLAHFSARLFRARGATAEQLAMAHEMFGNSPLFREISGFCRDEGHVVFGEQGTFSLLAHAVVHCDADRRQELTVDDLRLLRRLLIAAPALLQDRDDHLGAYNKDEPEDWLGYLTQNLLFNSTADFGSSLARSWALYGNLARRPDLAGSTPFPLGEIMADFTLTLEEQIALALGLYALLSEQGDDPVLAPDRWGALADQLRPDLDPGGVIASISSTPEEMRRELTGDQAKRLDPLLRWASAPFLVRPFLRMDDDSLLLTSPRALEAWPASGLHYRLLAGAGELRGGAGVQHFTSFAGVLTETYVLELVEQAHRTATGNAGGSHVLREQTIADEPGRASTDCLVVAGADVVALEISSTRANGQTRVAGDREALQDDLFELVVKRVKQLHRTIEAIHRGAIALPGPGAIHRIFPVVVNAEPIRWSAPLQDYLLREPPGLLVQPGTQPLQFLEIEDLEFLLSAIGRYTLADLIASKLRAVGRDPDMHQWAQADPTAPRMKREQTVQDYLTGAIRASAQAFESGS